MNAVSMALWGDDPMYVRGAERAARMWSEALGAEWQVLILTDKMNSKIEHATTIYCEMKGWRGLFERYCTRVIYPHFDHVIFRDADSVPVPRDVWAINQWCWTGTKYMVIRDHPGHSVVPGGLWGMRPSTKFNAVWIHWQDEYPEPKFWDDQRWLQAHVWPLMQRDGVEIYDSARLDAACPRLTDWDFCGNKFDANGKAVYRT